MKREAGATDFDRLLEGSRPMLVRYLSRMVGEANAEDVAQVAMANAVQAKDGFRGEASARTWLFRIAMNAARDWLRANRKPWLAGAEASDEQGEGDHPDDDTLADDRLVQQQMSQCVQELVQNLPEDYQTVLALSDCDELSDREIASILGVSVGAAKIRLHRARAALKRRIENGCEMYRNDRNVLCCDKKQGDENSGYPLADGFRLQVESPTDGLVTDPSEEPDMTTAELAAKQKQLIGIGASIAAGCQPCTASFAKGAQESGACERGVHYAITRGLAARAMATSEMEGFAKRELPHPELDDAFCSERQQLGALIAVAAALASNTASLVRTAVQQARQLGATDNQIRIAAEVGRIAKRGAERGAESALESCLNPEYKQEASSACCEDGAPCGSSAKKEAPCSCGQGG